MNLGNRTPQPKQIKVKNTKLIGLYKYQFPYCEACFILGKVQNTQFGMELHHIHGGNERSDETRNIIHLCHEHHLYGTTHDLMHGSMASTWNNKYIAIKCQKGDVCYNDLVEWNCLEEVMSEIIEIYKWESDKIIKQLKGVK